MKPESINKNYTLEARILTPVHIGIGAENNWLENADFIFDKGKVYLLDHKKVLAKMDPNEFAHFLTSGDPERLKNKLSGNLDSYAARVYECTNLSQDEIKTHLRAGIENQPVIPGSSLKGALRSVIIHHLKPSKSIDNNDNLNKIIMGSSIIGDDFGRFFKVSDAHFNNTQLVNTKIWNLTGQTPPFKSGWKQFPINGTQPSFNPKGFNAIYEHIALGDTGTLTLSVAGKVFKSLQKKDIYHRQSKLEEKEKLINGQLEYLFEVVNDHTRSTLKKEISFFKEHEQAEKTEKIIESLEALIHQIPEDNSGCILRLGGGIGFHTITGDWKLDSHEIDNITHQGRKPRGRLGKEKSAKSRRIAIADGQFMLMGFIKLRIITDRELKERERLEQQRREQERIEKELEEKRRKEERRKEQKVNELMAEADNLTMGIHFDHALQLINEAENLKPKDNRLTQKREKIQNAQKAHEEKIREIERQKAFEEEQRRKAEELKIRQEANKAEKEKEEQRILKEGLSPLNHMEDYEEGRRFIERYFNLNQEQIPQKEKALLKSFVARMIQKKPKNWKNLKKGNWKLIAKWIGKEETQQWFEELSPV